MMEKPFIFIDCRIAERRRFDVNEGHQPTCALFYVRKGSFRMTLAGKADVIGEGDCVLFSDTTTFCREVLSPVEFLYVKFRVNEKCAFEVPLPEGKIHPAEPDVLASQIRALTGIAESVDPVFVSMKEVLLNDILFRVYRENHPAAGGGKTLPEDATVRAAVSYIAEHLREKITVSDLCRAAGTNASTLNFRFHRSLRTSVGAYLTAARIGEAKRLLAGTDYTVSEIARKCGYENVYYFSTAFRREVGVAPLSFRKRAEAGGAAGQGGL